MATKWIIIIVISTLFVAYNVFFNPEDRGGYVSGLGQFINLIISLVILLALAVITLIIF